MQIGADWGYTALQSTAPRQLEALSHRLQWCTNTGELGIEVNININKMVPSYNKNQIKIDTPISIQLSLSLLIFVLRSSQTTGNTFPQKFNIEAKEESPRVEGIWQDKVVLRSWTSTRRSDFSSAKAKHEYRRSNVQLQTLRDKQVGPWSPPLTVVSFNLIMRIQQPKCA